MLFVRNLDPNLENKIYAELMWTLIGKKNLEKVFKRNDYAFLHFINRGAAERGMKKLKGEVFS